MMTGRFAVFYVSLMLLLSAVLLFSGCTTRDLTAEAGEKKTKIGIVFDIGGKDDRSFNAAAYVGAVRAKQDFPIVLRDVEPGDPTSIEPAQRAFAQLVLRIRQCRDRTRIADLPEPRTASAADTVIRGRRAEHPCA